MTSRISPLKNPYIYAQSLDINGDSEYWAVLNNLSMPKVTPTSGDIQSILKIIDSTRSEGRVWNIGNQHIKFYVLLNGTCVIRVKPLDLDACGRTSYIQIVTDNFSDYRVIVPEALSNLSEIIGRRTEGSEVAIAARFKAIMQLPRWLIFIHMCLFSRRELND